MLAIVVVIGLQLLPSERIESLQVALEQRQPGAARRGAGGRDRARRRHRVKPGRGALHLLPFLRHDDAARRQPHEPLRPAWAAPLPRARRDRARCVARRVPARAVRGPLDPARGRTHGPRAVRDAGARRGQARRLARRPAAVRRASPTMLTAWLSPDDGLDEARRVRQRRRRSRRAAGSPPGHRARIRAEPSSVPSLRRHLRSTRCWSPATRCPPRSTRSWRARSPPRDVQRHPRPAPRHRDLEELPRRLGRAVDTPGDASTGPTPSSCSSAPTRGSRWPAPTGMRWRAAGRTGRRSTPTACARMANTYRQGGAARVYWITLPTPRDGERASDQPRRQRGGQGGGTAVARSGASRRHRPDVHAGAVSRRDGRSTDASGSSAPPTGSTSTTPVPACLPRSSSGRFGATSFSDSQPVDSP